MMSGYLQKREDRTMTKQDIVYSLLVSNVGWILQDWADYEGIKDLYDYYSKSKTYSQVTLWSSDSNDPIEESYTNLGEDDDYILDEPGE